MSNNDTKKITMDDMNIMKWLVCFSKIECVGLSPRPSEHGEVPQEALSAATLCCCLFVSIALFRRKMAPFG